MATYTPNYGLHQWVPEDDFLRSDFNTDFDKLDTALALKNGAVFGTYAGNGEAFQFIDLGFTPLAVWIVSQFSRIAEGQTILGGLALLDHPVLLSWQNRTVFEIVENGFKAYLHENPGSNGYGNLNNTSYVYMAIRA